MAAKSIKQLTIIFFGIRCLKKLNQKRGLSITATDVKILYYIHFEGAKSMRSLRAFNQEARLEKYHLPRLLEAGFIELDKRRYSITFTGEQYLSEYAAMLSRARMDRVSVEKIAAKRRYW